MDSVAFKESLKLLFAVFPANKEDLVNLVLLLYPSHDIWHQLIIYLSSPDNEDNQSV